jgi:hypothetical protein
MEAVDESQFIIIGKYCISKYIMMSEPPQLYVTNSETNETNMYYSYKVFELLRTEGLDAEPLHEYFDVMYGITKQDRIRINELIKQSEEKEKMKQEDKNNN